MATTAPGRHRQADTPPEPTARDFGLGRLFGSVRDAVIVVDTDGDVVLWNPGAVALFGYSAEEAASLNLEDFVPERLPAPTDAARRRPRRDGSLLDARAPVEVPGRRKDGEEIVVELTLSPVDLDGRPFLLAVMRDRTEAARLRVELERRSMALEAANDALSDANDALEAFTYVVGHDLKEPVRALDALLGVVLEDHEADMPPEARALVERARTSSTSLSAMLRGLLEFGRVSRADLDAVRVDVREIVLHPSCRGSFEGLLAERRARLDVDAGAAPALAPHALACQVLGNLVSNALRHGGGDSPVVRVSARDVRDGLVEVWVEDNGVGLPRALVDRFNAGGQAALAPSPRGGFGLLIARRAVERAGGRMRLDRSDELGGARVRFTLPAADVSDKD